MIHGVNVISSELVENISYKRIKANEDIVENVFSDTDGQIPQEKKSFENELNNVIETTFKNKKLKKLEKKKKKNLQKKENKNIFEEFFFSRDKYSNILLLLQFICIFFIIRTGLPYFENDNIAHSNQNLLFKPNNSNRRLNSLQNNVIELSFFIKEQERNDSLLGDGQYMQCTNSTEIFERYLNYTENTQSIIAQKSVPGAQGFNLCLSIYNAQKDIFFPILSAKMGMPLKIGHIQNEVTNTTRLSDHPAIVTLISSLLLSSPGGLIKTIAVYNSGWPVANNLTYNYHFSSLPIGDLQEFNFNIANPAITFNNKTMDCVRDPVYSNNLICAYDDYNNTHINGMRFSSRINEPDIITASYFSSLPPSLYDFCVAINCTSTNSRDYINVKTLYNDDIKCYLINKTSSVIQEKANVTKFDADCYFQNETSANSLFNLTNGILVTKYIDSLFVFIKSSNFFQFTGDDLRTYDSYFPSIFKYSPILNKKKILGQFLNVGFTVLGTVILVYAI